MEYMYIDSKYSIFTIFLTKIKPTTRYSLVPYIYIYVVTFKTTETETEHKAEFARTKYILYHALMAELWVSIEWILL